MSNITKLTREPDEEALRMLEECMSLARQGAVQNLVIVWDDPEDGMHCARCSFLNSWHLLGALEYAKHVVLKTVLG